MAESISLNRANRVAGTGTQRKEGHVKFFNRDRGFGYVVDADRKEYFFNLNYVDGDLPEAGERVTFTPSQSERGAVAKQVRGTVVASH